MRTEIKDVFLRVLASETKRQEPPETRHAAQALRYLLEPGAARAMGAVISVDGGSTI